MRRLLAYDVPACALLICLAGYSALGQENSGPRDQGAAQSVLPLEKASAGEGGAQGVPGGSAMTPTNSQSTNSQTGSQSSEIGVGGGAGFDLLSGPHAGFNPLTQPDLSPEVIQLLELEAKFSDAVAAGGGKAFAEWFAEDGVTLANGRAAVIGKAAIAAQAQWDPKQYQLTWVAQGARMGPSNEMGFTWGHYDSTAKDVHGETVKSSGRYMTIWKKMQDGSWKVELESSSAEPQDAGTCCTLPKP